jgi:hypothetical protein
MVEIQGPSTEKKQQEQKGGMLKLKIAKKAYVFDVKKKFSISKNFLVKKKEASAEDMKEQLLSIFSRKKPDEAQARQASAAKAAAAKPSTATKSTAIRTIALVVLLLVILGGGFVLLRLVSVSVAPPQAAKPNVFSGSLDFNVQDYEVLSTLQGDSPMRVGYFLVSYAGGNLTALNLSARIFSERPATQAFLLNYAREGADTYPVFRRQLIESMRSEGIPINDIDMAQLPSLPGGAILVVPTGYMPKELLGIDSTFDYTQLLDRGVTIIYVGFPFDKTALDSNGLTIALNSSAVSFSKGKTASTDGFGLYDPQYVAASRSANSGLETGDTLYGSVSVLREGQGALLLLPQTIDGGWRGDGEAAAKDIARLIREEKWLTPVSSANISVDPNPAQRTVLSLFTTPFGADSGFAEFDVSAADLDGTPRRMVEVFKMEKKQLGEMSPRDPQTVPYYLSGQRTRLNIELKEPSPNPVKLYIRLYKDGSQLQEDELELGLTNPTTEKPTDIQVNAEPGTYVARVEDLSGKVYAATELDVTGLNVRVNRSNWQAGKFSFFLSAGGQPVTPRQLSVTMDGGSEQRYFPTSLSYSGTMTVIEYDYPGQIKAGNHTFAFSAGNYTAAIKQNYQPTRNFWDDPIVLVLGLCSAAIFAAGLFLRRPEKMRYGLDIPDFLPLSTIKIPVRRQTVLEVFDSVNAGYSWQWMPLRVEEIKNGFRRLTYNGKPILVGDYNLERILSRMKEEKLVKDELGYWGLARWEQESNHSIRYLTIYRILRNVFVNNAVKFSKLDSMKECDVKAIAGKAEIYLHIIESVGGRLAGEGQDAASGRGAELVVQRALASAKMGTTIIVFATEEERDSFRDSLTSASRLAVALKMEVNSGNIYLLPVKNAISAYLRGLVK